MSTKFSVSTIFKGVDRISKVFSKISRNGSKAFGKIGASMERLNRKTSKFQSIGGKAAAFVGIASGAYMAKQAIESTIQKGLEFEQTLINASVKFVDGAKKGTKAFENLKKTVVNIGATTEFTATQAAQGLDFLAMAGFNSQQAIAALPGVVDLATATNMDLARATDIASDSLGSFNLLTKDSVQLSKNLTRVTDVLAKTTTSSNVNMNDLFETIKDAAPIFTSSGRSLEEFAVITGIMANSGIKGTKAGTAIKNMMLNLQAPTSNTKEILKKMNVSIDDGTGKMKSMVQIVGDIIKGTNKWTDIQRNAAFATIFGKRAIAGATITMNAGVDGLNDYMDIIKKSAGSTKEMANAMRDTTENRVKIMHSAIEGLQLILFESLQPTIEVIVKKITRFADSIGAFIRENPTTIKLIKALAFVIGILTTTFILAAAGIWLFNAAILANPIVWIIGGIIAAGLLLYTFWDDFFNFYIKNWHIIAGVVSVFFPLIGALVAASSFVIENWEPVKEFFIDLFQTMKNGALTAVDFILSGVNKLIETMKQIPIIGDKFSGISEKIQKTRENLVGYGYQNQNQEFSEAEPYMNQGNEIITPQISMTKSMVETISKTTAEVIIKDQTGRAEMKSNNNNNRLISMEKTAGVF